MTEEHESMTDWEYFISGIPWLLQGVTAVEVDEPRPANAGGIDNERFPWLRRLVAAASATPVTRSAIPRRCRLVPRFEGWRDARLVDRFPISLYEAAVDAGVSPRSLERGLETGIVAVAAFDSQLVEAAGPVLVVAEGRWISDQSTRPAASASDWITRSSMSQVPSVAKR